jgi:hypothetical protein
MISSDRIRQLVAYMISMLKIYTCNSNLSNSLLIFEHFETVKEMGKEKLNVNFGNLWKDVLISLLTSL